MRRPLRPRPVLLSAAAALALAFFSAAPAPAQTTPPAPAPVPAPAPTPVPPPENGTAPGATAPAAAPSGEPLSLGVAIQRAVNGNADLRRERLAIETADARVQSATGAFDVNLTSGFTYQRQETPTLGGQDLRGGATTTLTLDTAISRALETGGAISLSARNSRSISEARLECESIGGMPEECRVFNSSLQLNFEQPLLQGLGPQVARANIYRTRIQKDQALLTRQQRASIVLRDVINVYWSLSYAAQDLAIQRSAVELAREQLRVTRAQIDVGRLAPVDAAAVERAIGERMQQVLVSEQEVLFRTLELRRLFGLQINPNDPLFAAADAPQAHVRGLDVNAEIARALEMNPQLRAVKLGIDLSEVDLAVARSALWPELNFVGGIGTSGRNRGAGLENAFEDAVSFENWGMTAGLRFAFPIQNREARGNARVARAAGERAQLEAADLDREIRNQVVRFSSQITTASKRLDLAKATVGFATQNLEAERARFSVGRSTNNEVLRVQQELKNAEIQVVRATVDLLIAQNNLSALTGDILQDNDLVLKGL